MKLKKLGSMALLAAATLWGQKSLADVVQVTDATLTAAGPSIHWSRTNTYVLNGYCYVKQGQTLTIEAGTIIKGKDGAPGVFGALFITAGAKIFANGTPSGPIVFTAEADNLGTAGAYPNLTLLQRGLWGGIVLLGKAVLNTPSDAGGAAASPKYDIFEGLPDVVTGGQNVNRFGGGDDNDSSGVMRYVSIRHGGKILESNKELNGLSICGVGRGTTLEFIEAYATADDGFEFFGGTVNTRYLVSAFNDDDAFDADQGHSGQHQFWFGIQAADSRDKGFELNGEPTGLATGAAPVANFTVYNATLIGAGVGSGGANNNVFTIREFAAPRFYNSIFTDFAQRGISIDAKSLTHLNSGLLDFRENLWFGFTAGNTVANLNVLNSDVLFTDTARSNVIADPMLMGISRTANGGLDPRPQAGSPALVSSLMAPNNGFLQSAAFKGAFDQNNLWLAGWTALSQLGVTPQRAPANIVQVTDASLTAAGPTVRWSRTNVYVLNGYCYVKQGQTLTIEAGTIVKGKDGAPGVFGALFITAGGKLFANGTANNPIVFTAEADNLGTAGAWPNLGLTQRGLWGGIVLLGKAGLNTPSDAGGAAASPKYDIFEGLPDVVLGGQNVHRFGGSDDNDNSGVLRYVSIRHGGKILESNKELNGLSVCGVGRGTTLEFIEAYATADDGFEFFGGTVNTRYLVSAFNDDDAFDADQGYSGRNQFWFSIQSPDARDKGFELNGEPTGLATSAAPIANFAVYNATAIGAGVGSGGANNNVFTIREYAAPRFFNSIFTDYAQRGVSIDAKSGLHLTNGILKFENNLWFGFTAGNTVANLNVLNSDVLFTDTTRSNLIADPMLMGISRSATGMLDPRPQSASPALAGLAKTLPVDGFLTPVNFVGAFGSQNWAADWTALSAYGVLSTAGAATPGAPPQPVSPVFNTQPPVNTVVNAGGTVNLMANVAGATSFQWFKNGVAIPGANGPSLTLNNVRGSAGLDHTGPSSSRPPFQEAVDSGYAFISLISVGDFAGTNPNGTPRRAAGVMDGLGAYDNGNGTFTVLANHEINEASGIARRHGAKGAFVTKFIIAKSNLAVLDGSDLITNVYVFNTNTSVYALGTNVLMGRFCAADLPVPTAFFNAATGKGSQQKLFMNGEEFSSESRAWAHIATGPEAGNSWQLPRFGRASWENIVASPFAQDKTIVAGLDDDGTTDSQVYFYIGTKQATGTNEVEKAGLMNGSLYGVAVAGLAQEVAGTTSVQRNFTLFNLGDASNQTFDGLEIFGNTNGVTAFSRVEDGLWSLTNPRDFYFLTTASFALPSRLWRLRFNDIANPEMGGVIDMLLDGTEGVKMGDNLGLDNDGNLLIQEDVGNQSHNGKTWKYVLATDSLVLVSQHRPNLVTTGQPGFLTQDEEASGIIDMTAILGYRSYLIADQMHGGAGSFGAAGVPAGASITELVENGQLQLMVEVANGAYTLVAGNANGSVTSSVANVTITAPPVIGDTLFRNGLPGATVSSGGALTLAAPTNAIFGTGPLTYQWRINGTNILGANSLTLTLPSFQPADLGAYSLEVRNAAGQAVSMDVPVALVDGAYFGGVIINGPIGARYQVEFATVLGTPTVWTPLTTVTLPTSPYIYVDTTSSGAARRFYRATPQP